MLDFSSSSCRSINFTRKKIRETEISDNNCAHTPRERVYNLPSLLVFTARCSSKQLGYFFSPENNFPVIIQKKNNKQK